LEDRFANTRFSGLRVRCRTDPRSYRFYGEYAFHLSAVLREDPAQKKPGIVDGNS
jgi:hypothetical protein